MMLNNICVSTVKVRIFLALFSAFFPEARRELGEIHRHSMWTCEHCFVCTVCNIPWCHEVMHLAIKPSPPLWYLRCEEHTLYLTGAVRGPPDFLMVTLGQVGCWLTTSVPRLKGNLYHRAFCPLVAPLFLGSWIALTWWRLWFFGQESYLFIPRGSTLPRYE